MTMSDRQDKLITALLTGVEEEEGSQPKRLSTDEWGKTTEDIHTCTHEPGRHCVNQNKTDRKTNASWNLKQSNSELQKVKW